MSLFNETVARAARAEKALDECQKRCADLEAALKAARADKLYYAQGRAHWPKGERDIEAPGRRVSGHHNELNNLSDSDVRELFRQHEASKPKRSKWIMAPFAKVCALLRRQP